MELYKIQVSCTNNYTSRYLDYIPENFEGIKITQKFNWQNPIGYTPTFSIDTMRVILDDKVWLDDIFDTYGLESIVTVGIYKLNSTATDYDFKSNFQIDFESYSKFSEYSEFALKSISCIDLYNEIKDASKNFTGASSLAFPTTYNFFINYVSLKKNLGVSNGDNTGYLTFEENEDARIYNDDTALYDGTIDAGVDKKAYVFNRDAGTTDIVMYATGRLTIGFTWAGAPPTFYVKLYKNNYANPVLTLGSIVVNFVSSFSISIDIQKTKISDLAFNDGDFLFVGFECDEEFFVIDTITGSLSTEMYVKTELEANQYSREIYYLTAKDILDDVFENNDSIEASLQGIGVTSAQSILKRLDYISLIPKDFLTDFCIANGAIVNFKNDGTVNIKKISTYFGTLLDKANAIELIYFKNVEIGTDLELNFASVSAGMQQQQYDTQTYLNDWNKILTFNQLGVNASENLNLSLVKFRVDYSGILDFLVKTSKTSTDTSTDLFLFDPNLNEITSNAGIIYDIYTPRNIMENWRKFMEFIFYNYNKNTLEFASNDGDDFNLQIAGVNQMDDFVFTGDNPKILPIKINLTCLIDDTDFTEKILKIANNDYMPSDDFGDYLYIFVTEAQTTDSLDEQEIKGNLIYFPIV